MGYERYFRNYGREFWIGNRDEDDKEKHQTNEPTKIRYISGDVKPHQMFLATLKEDIDLILEANWQNPMVIVRILDHLILNAPVVIDFFLYKKCC
jgi:hypothetical protein